MYLLLQRHRGDVTSFTRLLKMPVTNVPKQIVTLLLVAFGLISSSTANAQSSPADCKLGCTSNDVQIKAAYLSDASGNKLSTSFVCPQSGSAAVFLTLELTTKTPRVGVVIFANIKNFTGGTPGAVIATPSQCFGVTLNQPTNKVTFQNSFNWPCGTPIALTDVFLGWGTGNTNFCTGSGFQCPATSSKCFSLPPGQYIAIETPVPQDKTITQCSDQAGGSTSTFNLSNVSVTNSSNVTVTWWENFTAPGTFSNQITSQNLSSYSSASKIIYAKITSNADNTVFTVAQVTLVVNQTPNLTITNPSAVCSPATVDITAAAITAGSTLPAGTALSYYMDNNNSPGTEITSATAQSLGSGKYWIKAATATSPECSNTKSVTVTVNTTPAAPQVTITQPSCSVSTGTIVVNSPSGQGITYSINGSDYQTSNTFNVGAGTYNITAKLNNTCPSSATIRTINTAPAAAPAALLCILQQPDLCSNSTGSLRVTFPTGTGYQYSKDNGANWQTNTDFTGLAAGSNPSIKVKNADGCISSTATSCSSADASCLSSTT
ncbi:MAG TPA: hypothetical protein VGQ53_23045, partial [Chitinophagaceae bacterium]|nr:hypothetical protein [Chitinophagaceae bacterium]